MPFPAAVFDEIMMFDVLEYLDKPLECLKEVNRVAKDDVEIQIKIPSEPKMFSADVFMFKKLLLEFPTSMLGIIGYYWEREKLRHLKGYLHINEIEPGHIAKFFRILSIRKELGWRIRLIFFRKYLRRITKKFLREPELGQSTWLIEAHVRRNT